MTPVLQTLPRVAAYTWRLHWPGAVLIGAASSIVMLSGFAFKRSFGAPAEWVPGLIAIWQAPWVLAPFVSGWLSRLNPQKAWRAIGVAAGLPLLLVGLVGIEPLDGLPGQGTGQYYFFAVLLGLHFIVSVLYIPHRGGLMRANYPREVRGRMYGLREILAIASGIVAVRVAQHFLDQDPRALRVLFPVAGLLVVAGCWIKSRIRWRFQGRDRKAGTHAFHLREALRDRRFVTFELAFMLYGFGFLMSWPLHILLIEEELKLSYDQYTWAQNVAFPITQLAAMIAWGRFADRRGAVHTAGAAFTLLAVFLIAMPFVQGFYSLLAAFGLFGVVMSGVILVWSLGPLHFAPDGRGHAYTAVHFGCVGIRSVIAPFLGYWIKEWTDSFAVGYFAAAAFVALGALTMAWLARSEARTTPAS
ncbi:MAG: MFS transporter [Planctomycetota bacterium]